jgi:hypothetical protein
VGLRGVSKSEPREVSSGTQLNDTEGTRNAYGISVRKPLGKYLLGTLRCKCRDNINVDLGEGWS